MRVLSAANTGTTTPSATILCPAGSVVISGGARVETAPAGVAMARGAPGLVLTSMGPNSSAGLADAWNVTRGVIRHPVNAKSRPSTGATSYAC